MPMGLLNDRLLALILLSALLLLLIAAPVQAELVPPREIIQQDAPLPAWKEQWAAARELVRQQNYEEAAAVYEALLAGQEQLREARWELARLLLQRGEADRALWHFELLREAVPDEPDYARGLAEALLAAGKAGRAAELFRELVALRPDDPELLAGLVDALLARQRDEEARPHLERLVKLQGEAAGPALELARLYRRLKMPEWALPLLRRLAVGEAGADILQLAAQAHEELGQRERAAAYWQRLLAVDPGHAEAVRRLEAYMLTDGKGDEALSYLHQALAQDPDNPRLLRRLAAVYLDLDRPGAALPHLENYLELRPVDREVLQLTLETHNRLGHRAEALLILERLLALEGEPAPEKLLLAARIYRAQERYEQALELYPRILLHYRDDPALVAEKLHLLTILEREDEIGAILAAPPWRQRANEVLTAWYALAPEDRRVMVALAFTYLEQGDLDGAESVLSRLAAAYPDDPEMLRVRGAWREKRELPLAALRDYEQLLAQQPDDTRVRWRALQLAAELGQPDKLEEHWRCLAETTRGFAAELSVALARGKAGDTGRALAGLAELATAYPDPAQQLNVLLAKAKAFKGLGLPYEAEEMLRRALLLEENRPAVYRALFALALEQARYDEAETWLVALEQHQRFHPHPGPVVEMAPPMAMLVPTEQHPPEQMRLQLLSARGEHRAALRLLENLVRDERATDDGFWLLAARVFWQADAFWSAEHLIGKMLARPEADPEFMVLAALLSERRGRLQARDGFIGQALARAEQDPGRQLRLGEILLRYRLYPWALEVAREAHAAMPTSARAALLLAEALAEAGDNRAALLALQGLPEGSASLFKVRFRQVELLMRLGRLEEVLELSEALAAAHPWSEAALTLPQVHALWLQRRWQPALDRLEEELTPAVSAKFIAEAEARGVAVAPDEPVRLWGRLTGAADPQQELVDEVMAPAYAAALSGGDQRLRQLAAPHYARYRWQQRFALEQQSRSAVERRDFFAAVRAYERLERNYPGEEPILYDLAGLYHRHQRWEAEAAIYRHLQAADLHYPGLDEARRRNELQRRPRSTLAYGYQRETGRGGYKALARENLAASQGWSPFLGHELELSLHRLRYRDPAGPGSLNANLAEILYRRDVFAGVEVRLGLGAWVPAGGEKQGRDTLLGRAELAGDLGDRVRGRIAYGRELVEDTLASVGRGIRVETLTVAGGLDLLPRLEAGSAYHFHYFSDGNQTHGYDLSLDYAFLPDPTRLTAGYLYEFRDSRHGPQAGGPPLADGFGAEDHPYWAPRSYWRKTFAATFRHQLSDDPFGRDTPRYYTLRYASSYDSGGYGQQSLAGDFFLELRPGLVWQAGLELLSGSDYRRRQLQSSFTYRW